MGHILSAPQSGKSEPAEEPLLPDDEQRRHAISLRLKLIFPEYLIKQPVIGLLARGFDVLPDIRRAGIDRSGGWLLCALRGEKKDIDDALSWLASIGVEVGRVFDPLE